MIAFDSNILVYGFVKHSPFHSSAYKIIKECAEGEESWAIPWPCIHEFLAIVTNLRLFNPPIKLDNALAFIDSILASPSLYLIHEEGDYFSSFKEIVIKGKISGGMIHDARIAALCLNANVSVLYTADRDFSRFSKLKTTNPLIGE